MEGQKFMRIEEQSKLDARVGGRLDLCLLLGTWFGTDPSGGGIVKLVMKEVDGRLVIRAFGGGEPMIDWGDVEAAAYAANVDSKQAMAMSARYDFQFVTSLLAAYVKQGILVLDKFNTFHDESGRASYFTREFYARSAAEGAGA